MKRFEKIKKLEKDIDILLKLMFVCNLIQFLLITTPFFSLGFMVWLVIFVIRIIINDKISVLLRKEHEELLFEMFNKMSDENDEENIFND